MLTIFKGVAGKRVEVELTVDVVKDFNHEAHIMFISDYLPSLSFQDKRIACEIYKQAMAPQYASDLV